MTNAKSYLLRRHSLTKTRNRPGSSGFWNFRTNQRSEWEFFSPNCECAKTWSGGMIAQRSRGFPDYHLPRGTWSTWTNICENNRNAIKGPTILDYTMLDGLFSAKFNTFGQGFSQVTARTINLRWTLNNNSNNNNKKNKKGRGIEVGFGLKSQEVIGGHICTHKNRWVSGQ